MARASHLRVVAGAEAAAADAVEAEIQALEAEFRALFASEAQLRAETAALQAQIDQRRARYSALLNLRIRTSTDALRRQFGPHHKWRMP